MPMPVAVFATAVYKIVYFQPITSEQVEPDLLLNVDNTISLCTISPESWEMEFFIYILCVLMCQYTGK